MVSKTKAVVASCVVVGVAACGGTTSSSSTDSSTPSGPPISWEQFRDSAYKEPWAGGHYLVDGDIPLSDEKELREYYDSWSDSKNALTVAQVFGTDDIWPFSGRFDLTYCIGSSTGTHKAAVQTALDAATRSWGDIVGIRFTYLPSEDANCTATNANVLFDVQEVPDDGFFASSFFPDDTRDARHLSIRPTAYTTTAGGRDFEGIMRHELGHTLGFRHEHIWLTPTCTGESTDNAREVTPYDVNSVMHYPQCRPSGTGGYRQTTMDYEGAISLYGLSAQLILALE
jgi:hypothetical protein